MKQEREEWPDAWSKELPVSLTQKPSRDKEARSDGDENGLPTVDAECSPREWVHEIPRDEAASQSATRVRGTRGRDGADEGRERITRSKKQSPQESGARVGAEIKMELTRSRDTGRGRGPCFSLSPCLSSSACQSEARVVHRFPKRQRVITQTAGIDPASCVAGD